MNCPICNSAMSEPVDDLFALPSVTSDCRPWGVGRSVRICGGCGVMRRAVLPGADFRSIYDDYKSYPEPEGRTRKIIEFVKDKIPSPEMVLDLGCGQGDGVTELQIQYHNADVYGYDPYSKLWDVKPHADFKYDLVTLFHVFEHVEDIHEMLGYIKSILTDNGHLLIQVPYATMWPFDLILADHIWHFTMKSLKLLLNKSGFGIIHINNFVITKEITVLAKIGKQLKSSMIAANSKESIDWILNYKKHLDTINTPVAVYGTGPAAAWAGSILCDKVICYIDDDSKRWGEFNGKSVVAIIDKHIPVVAPFPDWQLPAIKAKHPNLRFL